MTRYIDADAIEKVLEEKHFNRVLDSDRWIIADIKKGIIDLPTIDAVPVIRCKDCIYYPNGIRFCIDSYVHCSHMIDDGFCSWAVRKGEE